MIDEGQPKYNASCLLTANIITYLGVGCEGGLRFVFVNNWREVPGTERTMSGRACCAALCLALVNKARLCFYANQMLRPAVVVQPPYFPVGVFDILKVSNTGVLAPNFAAPPGANIEEMVVS